MIWRSCLLGLALSALALDVSAQSNPQRVMISEPVQGYAYYNRPGASLDEHDTAFRDCVVATQVSSNESPLTQGVAARMIWGGVIQAIGASAVENCMIARGWRVFQLPEDQGREFSQLSDRDFSTRFGLIVGGAMPPGVLARQWENQTARPAGYHTPSRPRAPNRHHLSVRSYRLKNFPLELRTPEEAAGPSFGAVRGLPLNRAAAPGPGMAIVILRAVGSRFLGFARTEDTGGGKAFGISGNRAGVWQAFEVPAGRWRITRSSWIVHCLGSPAFDVAAGEVVYAGTFDLEGQVMGPTLDPSDVPDQLAAPLTERLRAAHYENGSTVPCPYGLGIYPLEIPGAPFEAGYSWGSLASAGAVPPG